MTAVSDSSPLILYSAIGHLELLQDIYDEIIVPPAVWTETVERGAGRPGSTGLERVRWIRRESASLDVRPPFPIADLHRGEAEAIALALSFQPAVPIILDDRRARQVAEGAGLEVIGSGGLLILAKRRGRISSIRGLLVELQSAGLYLSESVVETLLRLADEQ